MAANFEPPTPDVGRLEPRRFPCSQCGASLVYMPGTHTQRCDYCGHVNPIAVSDAPVLEKDYRQTLRELTAHVGIQANVTVHCDSCGASYSFEASSHAGHCPFCGSPTVAKTQQHRQLPVQALLPFSVTRGQARIAFRRWLGGLWFAPGKLKAYARNDATLNGMYVPYWTFSAETTTRYQGSRGENYQVQEVRQVVENGRLVDKPQPVTKIRWTPTSGVVSRDFDAVLVLASRSLPHALTERLPPGI